MGSNFELFRTVLLVEDDPSHALLIKRAFKSLSLNLDTVGSVQEAKKYLGGTLPDLVISDLNLPDSTGSQHVSWVAKNFPTVPIIVLTSSNSLADAVEAMRLGAWDFLVKNFSNEFQDVLNLSLMRVHSKLETDRQYIALRSEMEVLRRAIENSSDGLAVASKDGRYLYTNGSFRSFLKNAEGSLSEVGQIFGHVVIRRKELNEELQHKLNTLTPGAIWKTEIAFVGQNQHHFSLSLAVIGEYESPERVVFWVREISDQKRREKFQRDILSTTTHDLKGPLGAILLSSELLIGHLEEQKGKPYELATRIASSAQNSINLIDEFLSARRIEEGSFLLRPDIRSISELVEEEIGTYRTLSRPKNIEIILDLAPDAVAKVDRMAFLRVMGNLLSNAIKFTPKGGQVRVTTACAEHGAILRVEDTGSGIEGSELQKIFERFGRSSQHAGVSGSGLGLFVVRSISEAHGGRVEVTSQPGKGSSFTVYFPREVPLNSRGEAIALSFTH